MDSEYILGISELDAQHEDIERVFIALQQVVAFKERRGEIPAILRDLREKLTRHFVFEESVMRLTSYPEAFEHGRAHQQILKSLKDYEEMVLSGRNLEKAGQPTLQLFYDQILSHDRRFSRFIGGHKDSLGIN